MDSEKTYKKGDHVEEPGKYVCVPCGYHHEYNVGDTFGECTSCMSGQGEEMEDIEGTGLWEKEKTE